MSYADYELNRNKHAQKLLHYIDEDGKIANGEMTEAERTIHEEDFSYGLALPPVIVVRTAELYDQNAMAQLVNSDFYMKHYISCASFILYGHPNKTEKLNMFYDRFREAFDQLTKDEKAITRIEKCHHDAHKGYAGYTNQLAKAEAAADIGDKKAFQSASRNVRRMRSESERCEDLSEPQRTKIEAYIKDRLIDLPTPLLEILVSDGAHIGMQSISRAFNISFDTGFEIDGHLNPLTRSLGYNSDSSDMTIREEAVHYCDLCTGFSYSAAFKDAIKADIGAHPEAKNAFNQLCDIVLSRTSFDEEGEYLARRKSALFTTPQEPNSYEKNGGNLNMELLANLVHTESALLCDIKKKQLQTLAQSAYSNRFSEAHPFSGKPIDLMRLFMPETMAVFEGRNGHQGFWNSIKEYAEHEREWLEKDGITRGNSAAR